MRIDLVFRAVGERTRDAALELAKEAIRPDNVYILDDIKPFKKAVQHMLQIEHKADLVVHMDADCLILEDMRPFLLSNNFAYVDSYVQDRFRGRIHCGVHITRTDVLDTMRNIPEPTDDMAYVLRPESRLRGLALERLKYPKQYKTFHILHDHFQWQRDVWCKYALRELRSRTPFQRERLEQAMLTWTDEEDFATAKDAIAFARNHIHEGASSSVVQTFIERLPELAQSRVQEKAKAFKRNEVEKLRNFTQNRRPKVFGLGLSRTGTRSLTAALHVLGWDTVHYPIDHISFHDMIRGDGAFALLDHYDGLTDITTIPALEALDRQHPGSKFVLTVRDPEEWLKSAHKHWTGRSAFEAVPDNHPNPELHRTHMEVRKFLRAAVYGSYDFNPELFLLRYHQHVERVKHHFKNRPNDLLVMDVTRGDGYSELALFLGVPVPNLPFPHKGGGKKDPMDIQD